LGCCELLLSVTITGLPVILTEMSRFRTRQQTGRIPKIDRHFSCLHRQRPWFLGSPPHGTHIARTKEVTVRVFLCAGQVLDLTERR
jgi:hypothetical protein